MDVAPARLATPPILDITAMTRPIEVKAPAMAAHPRPISSQDICPSRSRLSAMGYNANDNISIAAADANALPPLVLLSRTTITAVISPSAHAMAERAFPISSQDILPSFSRAYDTMTIADATPLRATTFSIAVFPLILLRTAITAVI